MREVWALWDRVAERAPWLQRILVFVGPAFAIGVGTTTPIGRGFQFRWELRDNIVGIQRVTGATPDGNFDPPHGIGFKHLFSIMAGVDLVLERHRGRRY